MLYPTFQGKLSFYFQRPYTKVLSTEDKLKTQDIASSPIHIFFSCKEYTQSERALNGYLWGEWQLCSAKTLKNKSSEGCCFLPPNWLNSDLKGK